MMLRYGHTTPWFIREDMSWYPERYIEMDAIRHQYLNQHHTSSKRGANNSMFSSNVHYPTVARHWNRPLIASFNHPIRRRLREVQSYDLENLLAYGPQWVSKDHLRSLCSKSMPSAYDQSIAMHSISERGHPCSNTIQIQSEVFDGKPVMSSKIENVVYSYSSSDRIRASSVVIDPNYTVGQSITTSITKPSSTGQGRRSSAPHNAIEHFTKDTRNEDGVLTKYCQWFDSISSSILENNIDDSKCTDTNSGLKIKNENYQVLLKADSTALESDGEKTSFNVKHQDCLRQITSSPNGKSSSAVVKDVKNSLKAEKTYKNSPCAKETSQELSIPDSYVSFQNISRIKENQDEELDGDPSRRIQNIPCEGEDVLEWATGDESIDSTRKQMEEKDEKWNGNKNELFVDRLVSIANDYVKYGGKNRDDEYQKDDNQEKGAKDGKESKIVKENTEGRQMEKRRKRIEVLRRLIAQQENRLAKLKRLADGLFKEDKTHDAQKVSSVVKNDKDHPDLYSLSPTEDESDSHRKKVRFSVYKRTESKKCWKKRWLSNWSGGTADNCM